MARRWSGSVESRCAGQLPISNPSSLSRPASKALALRAIALVTPWLCNWGYRVGEHAWTQRARREPI
jgi:hypothetical protein